MRQNKMNSFKEKPNGKTKERKKKKNTNCVMNYKLCDSLWMFKDLVVEI